MGNFQQILGFDEIKKKKDTYWKALLAEFLGNFLLNFYGCYSCVLIGLDKDIAAPYNYVLVALSFGFAIFVLVQALGHVSGAHLNPAVTCAMMSVGNTTIVKGLLYIIAQCVGSLAGSSVVKALTPEKLHATGMGHTMLNPDLTPLQGFGVEFFLGFVLVLVVCGVCDPNRYEAKAAGPLAIGIAVSLGHLASIDSTGSSMNPARTFGSAVIAGIWDHHWIYWVGPILGGILAALIYKHALEAPETGPFKIVERYTAIVKDEKELKRLDKIDDNLA